MELAPGVPVLRFVNAAGIDNTIPDNVAVPKCYGTRPVAAGVRNVKTPSDVHVCTGNGNSFNAIWTDGGVRPVFAGISITGIGDTTTAFNNPDAAARVSIQRHGIATIFHVPDQRQRQTARFGDIVGIRRQDAFRAVANNQNLDSPIIGYSSTFRPWRVVLIPRWKSAQRYMRVQRGAAVNGGFAGGRQRERDPANGQFLWIGSFVGWGADNRNEMRVHLHTGLDQFGAGSISATHGVTPQYADHDALVAEMDGADLNNAGPGLAPGQARATLVAADPAVITHGRQFRLNTAIAGNMAESLAQEAMQDVGEPVKPPHKRAKAASAPSKPRTMPKTTPKGVGQKTQ